MYTTMEAAVVDAMTAYDSAVRPAPQHPARSCTHSWTDGYMVVPVYGRKRQLAFPPGFPPYEQLGV